MDLHTYKVHSLIFITSCPGSQRKLEPLDSLRNSNNKKILINLKKQQTQQESFPRYDPPPQTPKKKEDKRTDRRKWLYMDT